MGDYEGFRKANLVSSPREWRRSVMTKRMEGEYQDQENEGGAS
jgi:hypothetical protein